jgi:hypothetical protein
MPVTVTFVSAVEVLQNTTLNSTPPEPVILALVAATVASETHLTSSAPNAQIAHHIQSQDQLIAKNAQKVVMAARLLMERSVVSSVVMDTQESHQGLS